MDLHTHSELPHPMGRLAALLLSLPLLLIIWLSANSVQAATATSLGSAARYFKEHEDNRDFIFNDALSIYENHLRSRPDDVVARAERCRLIYAFAYDDQGYTLVEAAAELEEQCIPQLLELFPDEPEARLVEMEQLYGEDALQRFELEMSLDLSKWTTDQIQRYRRITSDNTYWLNDDIAVELALEHFHRDRSQIAKAISALDYLYESEQTEKARQVLDKLQLNTEQHWQRERLFRILTKNHEADLARQLLTTFDAEQQPNDNDLAQYYIVQGNAEQAQTHAQRHLEDAYNAMQTSLDYYEMALRQDNPATAQAMYTLFREQRYFNDPLLHHRWRLYRAFPELPLTLNDLLGLFNWLILTLLVVALPLLLIMPIHHYSLLRQRRGASITPFISSWNLKHVWIVLSLMVLFDLCSLIIWDYSEVAYMLGFDHTTEPGELQIARQLISYTIVMLIALIRILWSNWRLLLPQRWSLGQSLMMASLAYIGLRFIAVILAVPVETEGIAQLTPQGVQVYVMAIKNTYGLWLTLFAIGLLTPLIEEVMFRGVLLSAVTKHTNFTFANLLQACLFAALHIDWHLFIFYLAFGLITGFFVKHSRSLLPAIMLHIANNSLAVLVLDSFYAS